MTIMLSAACLAAALAVHGTRPAGRLRRSPEQATITSAHPRDGPWAAATDIRLFAACCRAGLPVALAAATVADTHAAAESPWHTVAALSALGVDAERAWAELHTVPGGAELASLVALSDSSGAALAAGCERIAQQLLDDAAQHATAAAERAGVLIALPLTACFLPAFFILGLAPVLINLGTTLLH